MKEITTTLTGYDTVVEYLTPGSYTYALPTGGLNRVLVSACAGGSGGGGGHATGGGGGGAAGGDYCRELPMRIPTGVLSLYITVGAAGAGGAIGADGATGGSTIIQSTNASGDILLQLTASTGGKAGVAASAVENGGKSGRSQTFINPASAGGIGSGNGSNGTDTSSQYMPDGCIRVGGSAGGGGGVNAGVAGNGGNSAFAFVGAGNDIGGIAAGAVAGGGMGGGSVAGQANKRDGYAWAKSEPGSGLVINATSGVGPSGSGGSGGATGGTGGAGNTGLVRLLVV